MRLEFYGPDLELLGSLTGQPTDAGANWSHVTTLTGVQYDANGDLVGPIYSVAFATETADDGELNRDEHSCQPPMAGTPRCTGCQSVYEHS